MQLKSILCTVDFSEFSVAAYQHALSLAEYYKARLIALHVIRLPIMSLMKLTTPKLRGRRRSLPSAYRNSVN
jgi:Universal stress protein family